MLVFVPLSPEGLSDWVAQGSRPAPGFAATREFAAAFSIGEADAEDAERTLLEIAGLDGLLRYGVRLVAVAEADAEVAEPAEFGAVDAGVLGWGRVTSLFADDALGAGRAASVLGGLGGLGGASLAEAWEDDAVVDLLAGTDLLWHSSTEWQRLSH